MGGWARRQITDARSSAKDQGQEMVDHDKHELKRTMDSLLVQCKPEKCVEAAAELVMRIAADFHLDILLARRKSAAIRITSSAAAPTHHTGLHCTSKLSMVRLSSCLICLERVSWVHCESVPDCVANVVDAAAVAVCCCAIADASVMAVAAADLLLLLFLLLLLCCCCCYCYCCCIVAIVAADAAGVAAAAGHTCVCNALGAYCIILLAHLGQPRPAGTTLGPWGWCTGPSDCIMCRSRMSLMMPCWLQVIKAAVHSLSRRWCCC